MTTMSTWQTWKTNFARWLAPDLAREADRLQLMRDEMEQAFWQFTGKQHEAAAVLRWLIDNDDIRGFREWRSGARHPWPAAASEFVECIVKGKHLPKIDVPAERADMAPVATDEFQNEIGNQIKITIEGPTSTSENFLTMEEVRRLQASIDKAMNYLPAESCTLAACPIGLFMSSGELCVKTEYQTSSGRIEAYIVSSGEAFWGEHPQNAENQRATKVYPIHLPDLEKLG